MTHVAQVDATTADVGLGYYHLPRDYELAMTGQLADTTLFQTSATIAPLSVRELRDVLATGQSGAVYGFVTENDAGTDIPASIVAPAMLFEDIEIRGPSTPNKRPPLVPRPPLDSGK